MSTKRLRKSKRPIENPQTTQNTEEQNKTPPTQDIRNPFESDFGRVIFSPATRRMHDKTQVIPLTADDNTHSRLTHSMEVMAIGYSIGIMISANKEFQARTGRSELELLRQVPLIIKSACLVHDIGNPPFGHFGETVIQNYFKTLFESENKKRDELNKQLADATGARKEEIENQLTNVIQLNGDEPEDFTGFDGNAQGFRVLTRLQILEDDKGLNLTSATLGAYLKYPNTGRIDKKVLHRKKRGVFQSEKDLLDEIAKNCQLEVDSEIKRHPFCFLMEAADSICYLVMDLEDGFNKGWYRYDDIKEYFIDVPELREQFEKLEKNHSTNGIEITRMANLRIYLIQRLVDLTVSNFIRNLDAICNGTYGHELIDDDPKGLAKRLHDFSVEHIFPGREITSLELTGHSVLTGLLDYYVRFLFHESKAYRKRAEGLISSGIKRVALIQNGLSENASIQGLSDYYKLRIIVDYVSGMTDQFALNHHQKLSGQKIS